MVVAPSRALAARRCLREGWGEPEAIRYAGYRTAAAESAPTQRTGAWRDTGRARRAVELYASLRVKWPLPSLLAASERVVSQESWRCFLADLGAAITKLERPRRLAVERWARGQRVPQDHLEAAFDELAGIMAGDQMPELSAALACALILIDAGDAPEWALDWVRRQVRISIPHS